MFVGEGQRQQKALSRERRPRDHANEVRTLNMISTDPFLLIHIKPDERLKSEQTVAASL
jgi:hypothetical protein